MKIQTVLAASPNYPVNRTAGNRHRSSLPPRAASGYFRRYELVKAMKEFQLIDGKTFDREWLYNLYQSAMKPCIEATWGWSEEFQSNGFDNNLKPTDWKIINDGIERIGGFVLKEGNDHLWLEMIIIRPEYRRKGIGRWVLTYIQSIAKERSLPLRLSVIKANPVRPFYLKSGFYQYDEDDSFYKMQWRS